ncbi:MAG: hotdog fold thioesterase [Candidatus Neomarinimicrobiota bacterium]|jgi:1,4-dihydroxy-2-naphthoyl-CoA hydrolase|uniref:Thioesterase domain-containing protein n=1 Tax=marine metagenome TaxID=408172 RepID=A0A381RPW6_9ZZZZ|nr:hotdog fold thioesterase [Candidatus Neomarinimicrobiota bacterium]MEC9273797.1 hotdog fold thioesterase [Candidatus Neomarinimicrobiota bacterium]MEE3196756.1 hotdog fold thioesterase [Candidatus Neomarinimicrobiota bacterium]|tara:strand:+ start:441 stop:881 length:441 start_codon:yes stop_codon:yes gene_type:complete
MNKTFDIDKINNFNSKTMVGHIGIEILEANNEYVRGRMPVDKRTIQPYGLLHGGASVAFAESLGSYAGSLHVNWEKEAVVGIEINANHLKSVRSGYVFGKATPIKIGKKIHVWNIEITNENEDLICISRLTLAIINHEKVVQSNKK